MYSAQKVRKTRYSLLGYATYEGWNFNSGNYLSSNPRIYINSSSNIS